MWAPHGLESNLDACCSAHSSHIELEIRNLSLESSNADSRVVVVDE